MSSYSRIIAALAHVNMIVRMYRLLRAQFSAKHLNRTVRNDLWHDICSSQDGIVNNKTCLVNVHIALSSRTSLEYNEWEMIDQFAGYYLPCLIS